MNLLPFFAAAALACASGVLTKPAHAERVPTTLVVSYVEVPASGSGAAAVALCRYALAVSRGPEHPDVEVLQEVGRPQRLAVLERWPGPAPADTGLASALGGRSQAPLDRRDNRAVGALMTPRETGPFHMLMHVDVVPAGAAAATDAIAAQRASVLAAPGGMGFELAVQADRPNHFAVHETWSSRSAYETYTAGSAARVLRNQLAAVKGALFDDRFFVSVKPQALSEGKR